MGIVASFLLFIALSTLSYAEPVGIYHEQEIECLAKNIYFEARNENLATRFAIAYVTLNRVKNENYPNTICKVVKQAVWRRGKLVLHHCQFSWFCDGKSDKPYNQKAWNDSYQIASVVYFEKPPFSLFDITEGSLFYHADYVNPKWAKSKKIKFKVKLGRHLFYIKRK